MLLTGQLDRSLWPRPVRSVRTVNTSLTVRTILKKSSKRANMWKHCSMKPLIWTVALTIRVTKEICSIIFQHYMERVYLMTEGTGFWRITSKLVIEWQLKCVCRFVDQGILHMLDLNGRLNAIAVMNQHVHLNWHGRKNVTTNARAIVIKFAGEQMQ